ncbi:MAG: hypothetical protein JXA77_03115 [Bacteroidales bacterium]|nr:hypothetical protein [Bacteroidales bacterium]MBN2817516.1 hypothetical protein [Bacteroidales bacterium]
MKSGEYRINSKYFRRGALWPLIYFLFLIISLNSFGVDSNKQVIEKIYLHTDRDYYVSGEQVFFKVFYNIVPQAEDPSKILYVEINDLSYNQINQVILNISENSAVGVIQIPDSLTSGSYIIKAYTNWQKNQGNELLFSKEILIINRFGKYGSIASYNQYLNAERTAKTSEYEIQKSSLYSKQIKDIPLILSVNKNTYSKREKVQVNVEVPSDYCLINDSDLSVSVQYVADKSIEQKTPSINNWFSYITEQYGFTENQQTLSNRNKQINTVYPKETEGRIITGVVSDIITGMGLPGALVYFSFFDTLSYLDYDITDENGSFFFAMPDNLSISPGIIQVWESPSGVENSTILLDLKVDNKASVYKAETLTAEYINMKFDDQVKVFEINNTFRTVQIAENKSNNNFPLRPGYYGLNKTVYPRDFLKLSGFDEIAKEILPGVRFRLENGEYTIRILNEYQNAFFTQPPLLLINGMPVKKYNYLAVLNSDDIHHIDIVSKYFIVGSRVYHGVLSVTLNQNSSFHIEESNTLIALQNEISNQKLIFNFPVYDTPEKRTSRIPDFRNTLYWNPEIILSANRSSFEFYTSDMSGEFRITIVGVINNGIPVSKSITFNVEDKY